jgi:hypothetical protein
LVGSKLCFYGVFVSGNIMSKARLSMGDWLRGLAVFSAAMNAGVGNGLILWALKASSAMSFYTFTTPTEYDHG